AALVAFVVIVYSSVHANDAAIYAEISQEPFDQEDEDSSFEGDQDQDGRKDQAATTAKADKNADSDSVETKPTFDSIVVEAGKPQADDQAEGRSDASDESSGPVSSASDSAGDPSSDGLAF
ncbi:MAG: glycerol transporter, partial [Parascardovia denticolens]